MRAAGERRLSTPVVLAAASAMLSIGVIAWVSTSGDADPPPAEARSPNALDVAVDTSTPALAAESFLDAWRKRAHRDALALSAGEAHAAVEARASRDDQLSDEERAAKQQIWNAMAETRLRLMVDGSEDLPEGRVMIHGTAEGEFLERPYERRVSFVLSQVDGDWKVERIEFGEIVSDVPDFLELDDSVGRDPSEFEVRGALPEGPEEPQP
jgi:hypothetical protein